MRFHSNAGMCSHSDHIIQIFRINYLLFVSIHSNQASQELKTMCKTPLKMTFCSKNITFHNHMITNQIF